MGKLRLLFIAALVTFLPRIGFSDIVVTTDGMILNGKIIEIENEYVKLGNYHGIFKINNELIKEMHQTTNYQDDMKIIKKMGKYVNETVVKNNFQSGIEKLNAKIKQEKKIKADSIQYLLHVSPFFMANIGKARSILPYSFITSLMGDIRFNSRYNYLPNGGRIDLQYFYSGSGTKKISAYRFGLGPVWNFPFEINGFSLNLTLSPTFGTGYYSAKGRYDETASAKFNASFAAGMECFISSWVISYKVRFEYIHDAFMPLYGIGASVGVGYLFNK